jgi:hypothetical protein
MHALRLLAAAALALPVLSHASQATLTFQCPKLQVPVTFTADLNGWAVGVDEVRDSHPEQYYCSIGRMMSLKILTGQILDQPLSAFAINMYVDQSEYDRETCDVDEAYGRVDQLTALAFSTRGHWCLSVYNSAASQAAGYPVYDAGPNPRCLSADINLPFKGGGSYKGDPDWNQATLTLGYKQSGLDVYAETCKLVGAF